MAQLTRDAILGATDIETEEVDVPQWGGTVLVRGLSGTDRDDYEASLVDLRAGRKHARPDLKNTRAKLVVRCIVDENGNKLFSERDIALLGRKSAAALDRVYEVAARLSGLGGEAEDDAEGN
jgi:hypothetical protein